MAMFWWTLLRSLKGCNSFKYPKLDVLIWAPLAKYTLNRKSLTCFVRKKPRGSVVITKPLALRTSLCARKASWLYYMDLYYQIMLAESLCFTKGTVYPYYSLWKKTNGPQLGMSARELTMLLLTVFLCKYMKVLWLCKSKGFHNLLLRV